MLTKCRWQFLSYPPIWQGLKPEDFIGFICGPAGAVPLLQDRSRAELFAALRGSALAEG